MFVGKNPRPIQRTRIGHNAEPFQPIHHEMCETRRIRAVVYNKFAVIIRTVSLPSSVCLLYWSSFVFSVLERNSGWSRLWSSRCCSVPWWFWHRVPL